jgi:hypothetical protein
MRASPLLVLALWAFAGCSPAAGSANDQRRGRDSGPTSGGNDFEEEVPPEGEQVGPDTQPTPDDAPASCTPICKVCGGDDGCGDVCKTGSCKGGGSCVDGTCEGAPTAPSSRAFPTFAFGPAWPRPVTYTIATEGEALIKYSTDGLEPSSQSAPSPAKILVPESAPSLKWFAEGDGAKESTQEIAIAINPELQKDYGFVVEGVNIAGRGPIVVASPGAKLAGTAQVQAWTSGEGGQFAPCSGCRLQVVYAVGDRAVGCLYDWSPGLWPGKNATGTISITAPTTPGTYEIRATYELTGGCTTTLGLPFGKRGVSVVGLLVVR